MVCTLVTVGGATDTILCTYLMSNSWLEAKNSLKGLGQSLGTLLESAMVASISIKR